MERAEYVIIGGGVAGTTAAETIRGRDATGRIAIVSEEPYRFYSRIMLSKPAFFLGKIPFDRVFLKPEAWYALQRIELVAERVARTLDTNRRVVTLDDGRQLQYGKLLLAIGGCARSWPVPGADTAGVVYLRTLDDARALIAAIPKTKVGVTIGSGFVSFEMTDLFHLAGIKSTIVMREPYYWHPLLTEAEGRFIEAILERAGTTLVRGDEAVSVEGGQRVTGLVLKSGKRLDCDLIVPGIGITCSHQFAASAGIAVHAGILANEYLETSAPSVWTAGDSAEYRDVILGETVMLGNWVNAQMQGRLVGRNMTGEREPFRFVSFYTAQGLGVSVAFVGDVRILPDRETVVRADGSDGTFGRLLLKDGELVGAVLINRTTELKPLTNLIAGDVRFTGRSAVLADPTTDLATLA